MFATQFSGKTISLEIMFSWPGPLNFGVFVLICSYSKLLQEEKELKKSLLYQALLYVLSLLSSHPLVVVIKSLSLLDSSRLRGLQLTGLP